MKQSKDWVLLRGECWILHHSAFQKPKVWHLLFFHKHSFSSFFFLYFFPLFLDLHTQRNQWSLWLPDFKSGFRNRWAHTESRSLLTLKLEDIQIWSRLGSSSCRIEMHFPILLTGSLFLAGRGTTQWCTAEPHSPNRRPTKNLGLPPTADSQTPGTNSNMQVSRGSILLRTLWTVLCAGYVPAKILTSD